MQRSRLAGCGSEKYKTLLYLYYEVKPFLPKRFRYGMRTLLARAQRKNCSNWPVNLHSSKPPEGWKGWPEHKDFCLVLTHDIESQLGVERCHHLVDLESQLGFRSSLNFIPEGEYKPPLSLYPELEERSFEVGVHDLKHDGKLFRSRKAFEAAAPRINQYLADWKAVGFRAGFMFHQLDWINDLNIEYDASTFDTDPFEPQSDGIGTIFPFWVSRAATGKGYVELPYTLAQDSTLFIILRERSNALWKQKLDWIVQHKGMALLNLHPDNVNFTGQKTDRSEFDSWHYEDFLLYIREKYSGRYWHALPREVARFYKDKYVAR